MALPALSSLWRIWTTRNPAERSDRMVRATGAPYLASAARRNRLQVATVDGRVQLTLTKSAG